MSWNQIHRYRQWLALERGLIRPNPGGKIRIALAFPNVYRLGMANLGFQTVYRLLNATQDVLCERVFYPDPDLLPAFRDGRERLVSVESGTPVRDFDLLAFSLPFENDSPNILEMIRFCGIPVRAEDRSEGDPLVALGGVVAFLNPEPLAPFMDFFFVGEAEGMLKEFRETWCEALQKRLSRAEFLELLGRSCPGVYVPRFHHPEYERDGVFRGFVPSKGFSDRIQRAGAGRPGEAAFSVLVSEKAEFSETALVEVGRGCGRGCRFCAAGFVYRPPRFLAVDAVWKAADRWRGKADRVGLVSAAVSDHPDVDELCKGLMDRGFRLTFSSLRADRVSPEILQAMDQSALKSVAIAPEAGSERLRRVINKDLTDEEILEAADRLTSCGILHLKLYFMIGLPTETSEDLAAIVDLVKRIKHHVLERSRGKKRIGTITVSVHSFVPKPFTPFQWVPFAGVGTLKERARKIRQGLGKVANVRVHFDLPKWAYVQALLSRGDRRVADLLEKVALERMGWSQAFKRWAYNPDFWVVRQRERDEVFPWEIVDHGIRREYLWSEYERALAEKQTPPCGVASKCVRCGVCQGRDEGDAPKCRQHPRNRHG